MVTTVRLNAAEEAQFKKDLELSGQKQAEYIKSKLFSKSISEKTLARKFGETVHVLAELNIELKSKGVDLSKSLTEKLDKEIQKYVCDKDSQ